MRYLRFVLILLIGFIGIKCSHKHHTPDINNENMSEKSSDSLQLKEDNKEIIVLEENIDSLLSLSKGACFGKCPVYSFIISQEGEIFFNGKMFLNLIGKYNGQLTSDELIELKKNITEVNYFGLKSKYPINERYFIPDLPNTNTEIKLNGNYHKIFNNNSAPKSLTDFERYVEDLVIKHPSLMIIVKD